MKFGTLHPRVLRVGDVGQWDAQQRGSLLRRCVANPEGAGRVVGLTAAAANHGGVFKAHDAERRHGLLMAEFNGHLVVAKVPGRGVRQQEVVRLRPVPKLIGR